MKLLSYLHFRVDLSGNLHRNYRFLSFKIPLLVIWRALRNGTSSSDSQWRLTLGEEAALGAEYPGVSIKFEVGS